MPGAFLLWSSLDLPSTPGNPPAADPGAYGDIRKAVYLALLNDPGVAAIVGARVYPANKPGRRAELPQGSRVPAITFQVVSLQRAMTLTAGAGMARARVQVDLWDSDYGGCIALAELLREKWQGYRGTMSSVEVAWTKPLDEVDLSEPPQPGGGTVMHHIAQDWRFHYRETIPTF